MSRFNSTAYSIGVLFVKGSTNPMINFMFFSFCFQVGHDSSKYYSCSSQRFWNHSPSSQSNLWVVDFMKCWIVSDADKSSMVMVPALNVRNWISGIFVKGYLSTVVYLSANLSLDRIWITTVRVLVWGALWIILAFCILVLTPFPRRHWTTWSHCAPSPSR